MDDLKIDMNIFWVLLFLTIISILIIIILFLFINIRQKNNIIKQLKVLKKIHKSIETQTENITIAQYDIYGYTYLNGYPIAYV